MANRGVDSKLYLNTGTYGTPSWTELTKVRECKLNYSRKTVEDGAREEKGLETHTATRFVYDVTGTYRKKAVGGSDTSYDTMNGSYHTGVPKEYLVLNDGGSPTTNGSEGVRGYFILDTWGEDQGVDAAGFKDFRLMPAVSPTAGEAAMRRAKVASGALTYADINSDTFA